MMKITSLTPSQIAAGMTIEDVEKQRAEYWERRKMARIERNQAMLNTGIDIWPGMPKDGIFRDGQDPSNDCRDDEALGEPAL
jgi:hypothetical protein